MSPDTQQKHPDSPLWHPAVPLTLTFSWRCLLGIHHWPQWSAIYTSLPGTKIGGIPAAGIKMQERYCQHCNRREARNAV